MLAREVLLYLQPINRCLSVAIMAISGRHDFFYESVTVEFNIERLKKAGQEILKQMRRDLQIRFLIQAQNNAILVLGKQVFTCHLIPPL